MCYCNIREVGARIQVIDLIDTTHEGPCAYRSNGTEQIEQQVHLVQGSLDGACGPYCVMMSLLITGLIDRREATLAHPLDGRTSLGKLFRLYTEYEPFFRNGTGLDELKTSSLSDYRVSREIMRDRIFWISHEQFSAC